MPDKIERKIKINSDSSLLHVVGMCGIKPADEDEILKNGYVLTELSATDDVATFVYEKEDLKGET
jgi:hypothetical protein